MRKIALCMELSDYYEHGITKGLARYAKTKDDWRLYGYGWMFRPLSDLERWDGDGIIARVEESGTADRLSALGLPVVDVAGAYERPYFVSVTNDDLLTGYEAALHLLGCGFSRFAFLGVSGTAWSDRRKRGFEKALERHGLGGSREGGLRVPFFERPLSWWEGREGSGKDLGEDLGVDASDLEGFLSGLEKPIALFACNDTTGLRATELAGRLGIVVPESLAILGVDDEDILCELASPSLSSIKLDCEAIGFRAAATLDSILEGHSQAGEKGSLSEESGIVVPPKEVAERESTRIFACEDALVALAATYIRSHAHEGIDVSDVLELVSASRRSLETRFRSAMGRSLHEEITKAKLARARRLLLDSDRTMDLVAEESGFGSPARFHSAFKEAEGLSPGEWRKKNKDGR